MVVVKAANLMAVVRAKIQGRHSLVDRLLRADKHNQVDRLLRADRLHQADKHNQEDKHPLTDRLKPRDKPLRPSRQIPLTGATTVPTTSHSDRLVNL
jgi:hypothetical protein